MERGAPPKLNVWAVMQNGAPRDKVDLLLMGDGYTAAEMEKWHRDARRMAETLFAVSPFKEHRQDFNVWAVDTPAEESGVARPSDGVFRRSPLRAAYDAFGSERYVLTFDNKRLREAASAAPYEFIEIVVNDRKYGGGGIFNLFATVSADNAFTPYVFVHEFGHHFAGLADEYYTSDVAYGSATERPEPWEPNATADPARREVERPADRRHRSALHLAEEGVRADGAGDPGAPARDPRATPAGSRHGGAVPRRGRHGDTAPRLGSQRGQGRRVRRRDVRRARLLPPAAGLHHVHARRGRFLRRLPPRHRTRDSHVREVKGIPATPHYRGMKATLWIFLALAALARADENADRDAIRKILGTFNDQLAR